MQSLQSADISSLDLLKMVKYWNTSKIHKELAKFITVSYTEEPSDNANQGECEAPSLWFDCDIL